MFLPKKFKIAFKVISAAMAGIFLWNQVAWAGDLIGTALENQYKEQSQTFAPAYLKNQQSAVESLISQKQDISDAINAQSAGLSKSIQNSSSAAESLDLKGPRGDSGSRTAAAPAAAEGESAPVDDGAILSVTTQDGDIIRYKGSIIDSIEKKDGTVLRELTLDEDNNLIGAEITYADGTIQTVANGKVSQAIRPDGTILNYNDDELISSIVYPGGQTADCFYTKDEQGSIIETILTDPEKTSYYDSDNRLTKVEFGTGKTIEYDNGVLSKAIDTDGTAYLYETTEVTQDDVTEYVAKLKTIISVSGVRYDINDNNIESIDLSDRSLSNFSLDGSGRIINGEMDYLDGTRILVEDYKIKELTDTNGIKTIYQYSPDGLMC
ncbi:MAG: hypothetical protein PHV48_07595, partial [Candidatus Omnitrophica bacterium]|nr:hypothetical protein [Candidatus Omnitrophota bacterium]